MSLNRLVGIHAYSAADLVAHYEGLIFGALRSTSGPRRADAALLRAALDGSAIPAGFGEPPEAARRLLVTAARLAPPQATLEMVLSVCRRSAEPGCPEAFDDPAADRDAQNEWHWSSGRRPASGG